MAEPIGQGGKRGRCDVMGLSRDCSEQGNKSVCASLARLSKDSQGTLRASEILYTLPSSGSVNRIGSPSINYSSNLCDMGEGSAAASVIAPVKMAEASFLWR
jgi:hypothetical protein